jgi:hypothetical protein
VTERLRTCCDEWITTTGKEHSEILQVLREASFMSWSISPATPPATYSRLQPPGRSRSALVPRLSEYNRAAQHGRPLTDALADPVGMTERYHSERLYRFARTAWCYQPPPNSPEPAITPRAHVVFGCFNNLARSSRRSSSIGPRS